jgi:hypothetical protein
VVEALRLLLGQDEDLLRPLGELVEPVAHGGSSLAENGGASPH